MSGIGVRGIVGPQAVNAGDAAPLDLRLGKTGEAIVSELHARYFEQTARGNAFVAASQAVATTTVGLATTYTGLCISNPVGSGKAAAILIASLMQSVIQATQPEAYAIATGFNFATDVTHTTPVTTRPTLIGSGAKSAVNADSAATLPTAPFYSVFLGETASATTLPGTIVADLGGSIVLLPGAYAAFVTPAQASVAGLWFSFIWEEVPLPSV